MTQGMLDPRGEKAQFEYLWPQHCHFLTGIIYTPSKYICSVNEKMYEKQ